MRATRQALDAIDRLRREGRVTELGQVQAPAPADRVTEREFQGGVLALAKRHGWLAYHTHDSRRSQPGFPDLVLVRAGRLIFAELKTADGVLTADQRTWGELLAAVGPPVEYAVWRPSNWPEIATKLA